MRNRHSKSLIRQLLDAGKSARGDDDLQILGQACGHAYSLTDAHSITKDDLEFSVASKKAVWDVAFDDDLAPAAAHGAGGHGAYGYPPQAGAPGKSAW